MKNGRQIFAASALMFVFATFALAGNMSTPIAPPPPPSAEADGQMTTGSSEAVDPATQVALSLLQSVLALF